MPPGVERQRPHDQQGHGDTEPLEQLANHRHSLSRHDSRSARRRQAPLPSFFILPPLTRRSTGLYLHPQVHSSPLVEPGEGQTMKQERPRIVRLSSHRAWRDALAEQRRQEIYQLTRSFELPYLDALCERLRRRLARLPRRRHA